MVLVPSECQRLRKVRVFVRSLGLVHDRTRRRYMAVREAVVALVDGDALHPGAVAAQALRL